MLCIILKTFVKQSCHFSSVAVWRYLDLDHNGRQMIEKVILLHKHHVQNSKHYLQELNGVILGFVPSLP